MPQIKKYLFLLFFALYLWTGNCFAQEISNFQVELLIGPSIPMGNSSVFPWKDQLMAYFSKFFNSNFILSFQIVCAEFSVP